MGVRNAGSLRHVKSPSVMGTVPSVPPLVANFSRMERKQPAGQHRGKLSPSRCATSEHFRRDPAGGMGCLCTIVRFHESTSARVLCLLVVMQLSPHVRSPTPLVMEIVHWQEVLLSRIGLGPTYLKQRQRDSRNRYSHRHQVLLFACCPNV